MSRWSTFSLRQQGLLLTGGGAMIMAPDALLIKVADLPDAEILMWRGFLSGLGFLLIALLRYGRGTLAAYRRCGWTGIAVALLFSLTTCGFVLGNQYTKAGNVLMILASSPLIAAVLSWFILKERLPRRTWLAIFICMLGIAMIALDDAGAGSWVGNAFALMAATTLAINFTLCRTRPGVDMSPMLVFNGIIVGSIAGLFWLAGSEPTLPAANQLAVVILLCLIIVPCGVTLLQRGPLYLPSAEVGLLLLLEVVIGTLLAWWILAEQPAPMAMVGGVLVLGTLSAKGLYERRLELRMRAGLEPSPPVTVDRSSTL
ncbi:DMT family transporter [Halomonas sp. QX-2]|jgi:drug/metabolite transporter (DMT)-like permease|uniref:DMT family transporter n=1 Tax=Vreelandella sedimenti TaxID=2729618 RepID=A0A7Z0N4B1_9GAMM|nr:MULTISPECIES: DMT family transporter [Halomonas]NYT71187.1 DMT family transporter [Halomonas sedimenti]|tara:strand:- start:15147 stop:16091 length:945 start_codon:yes stop_codon:yes gene_type:complete